MRAWFLLLVGLVGCPSPKAEGDRIAFNEDAGSDAEEDAWSPTASEDTGLAEDGGAEPDSAPGADVGDTGATDLPLEQLPSAGFVELFIHAHEDGGEFRYGTAWLLADYTLRAGSGVPFPPIGSPRTRDECQPLLPGEYDAIMWGFSTSSLTYWDVGPELTLLSEHDVHTYERLVMSTTVSYTFDPRVPPSTGWSGGTLTLDIPGTADIPGAVYRDVLDVPPNSFAATFLDGLEPVEFTWAAGAAHEISVFAFDGDHIDPFCFCRVADDGAFRVPWLGCLDEATASGLALLATSDYYRDVEFNGRRLQVDVRLAAEVDLPPM